MTLASSVQISTSLFASPMRRITGLVYQATPPGYGLNSPLSKEEQAGSTISAHMAVSVMKRSVSTKKSRLSRALNMRPESGNIRPFSPRAKMALKGYGLPSRIWRGISMACISPSR